MRNKILVQKNYEKLTRFVYENLSWGPLFREKDGSRIANTDNDSSEYIKISLKKMNIRLSQLKNMNVFNIGTGRESRFFASKMQTLHMLIYPKKMFNHLISGQK